jgi:alpha-L-rhamnosidase
MYVYYSNIVLYIVICWSIVNASIPSPFDIRIDHHKVDTTRDLIVNTPRPRFSWKIPLIQRNLQQTAYQIQLIEQDQLFEWNSERVQSSESIHVPYTGEQDLFPSSYYRFRIRVWIANQTEASQWTRWISFRTPIFNLHEYLTTNDNLLWIGSTKINMNELRKEFNVSNTSSIKSAIVYICGLGYYEFYLNGNKVDPSRKLDPGWTTYEKRTLIVSNDITANITVRLVSIYSHI